MKSVRLRGLAAAGCVTSLAVLLACGSSSKSVNFTTAGNSQTVVVNAGPNGNSANGIFTTVTVCVPGNSNCQNISGVLVDTGSFGLRVLTSALGTVASSLPQQTDASGNSVFECAQFVSTVTWGPVKSADVVIGNEKASSIPVQVIDSSVVPPPAGCVAHGPAQEDLSGLRANGILGIGFFLQDCGNACTLSGTSNPGFYYGCAASSCQVIAQSVSQQVQNPVGAFATDNNGVVVQLPTVASSTASVSGTLVFGIGTNSGNSLGTAQVFVPDNSGNLTTVFKNQSFPGFLDSGSNAYFFLDSASTGLPNCPSAESGFYCPPSPVNFSVTNTAGTSSSTVNFTIGNASQLFATSGAFVFPTLGGPNLGTFDWGLPFFFGRKVFVALEGQQTPAGPGPFWAY